MKLLKGVALLSAFGAAAVTVLLSATPSEAKWDKVRFRCKAQTETASMDVRFEERTRVSRKKEEERSSFRAHFEGSAEGLAAGSQLTVVVDSVAVGSIALVEEVPGELEGQLRFDSKGKVGKKVQPFPATFPVIEEGALVEFQSGGATVLACELD
jgi:hypothetical protein